MPAPLVLASGSRYRKQQLQHRLRLQSIRCIAPNIDESPRPKETANALALRLSVTKAQAVAESLSASSIVIAGDQSAQWQGQLLHKPGSVDAAVAQLLALSGQTLTFYSGVCVLHTDSGDCQSQVVTTEVHFRPLSPQQIDAYVAHDHPIDCVGAFKNEGLGIALFSKILSEDPSALTGLPLIALTQMLMRVGVDPLIALNN